MSLSPQSIIEVLTQHPGSDKYDILRHLRLAGVDGETTWTLNSVLYRNPRLFCWSSPPRSYKRYWYLKSHSKPTAVSAHPVAPKRSFSDQLDLYDWQRRALAKWREDGYRGIIEAVTGAGKTRLAVVAAAGHLQMGWRVVTVVPTRELMNQWQKEYERLIRGKLGMPVTIGRMGDNSHDTARTHNIVVSTAASAARYQMLDQGQKGLLIADECHHYGAEKWSRALEEGFQHRLGLTATCEREDNGCEEYLTPYFGELSYQLGYEEALDDGVIANFKIAFIGAKFSSGESEAYDKYDRIASYYRKVLIKSHGVPEEPFGLFMKEVNRLKNSDQGKKSRDAGFYLSAFTRRRNIMAAAAAKLRRIWELRDAVAGAQRTITFAQTREAAQKVISILSKAGISGAVLDATMDMDSRKRVFADFERGENDLVAAPRLLDEGVDVPSADLGIVLATSRSRRQLIQRMGRVLRLKEDGRMARVVILYIEGTAEDPEQGAQEDFLEYVTEAASEIKVFRSDCPVEEICSYLNDLGS